MALTKGVRQILDEAYATVVTLPVAEALTLHQDPEVLFVDVRDVRELQREGMIPKAFHAPRGILEFWVDPESPYYQSVFIPGRRLVLYCASGWRSALACKTLMEMGVTEGCHIQDGLPAWKDAGGPITAYTPAAG